MFTPCKVCTSERKEYIEDLILKGYSNIQVSTTLKSLGEDTSHASINRHKAKHMPEHIEHIKEIASKKHNRKYDRNDYAQISPLSALNKVTKIKSSVKKFKFINEIIQEILVKQVNIVLELQRKFMEGETKYPYEEIRGLQIINDIVGKFETLINTLPDIIPINISDNSLSDRANEINAAIVDGKITVEMGNKLLSALSASVKIYEFDELEKRVSKLEGGIVK